jgi:hypothetical protein
MERRSAQAGLPGGNERRSSPGMKLWVRLNADSPRDPRIGKLADILGVPHQLAYGMVVSAWCAMAEHAPNGDLSGVADSSLNGWAGWPRSEKNRKGGSDFAETFRSLFLDDSGHDPDYADQQGKLVERARLDRERMARREKIANDSEEVSRNLREDVTRVSALRNGTERDEKKPPAGNWFSSRKAQRGEPMMILAELRSKRRRVDTPQGGVKYYIEKSHAESLDPVAREVLEAVGGLSTIANATELDMRVIRSQYADMYAAFPSRSSTDAS